MRTLGNSGGDLLSATSPANALCKAKSAGRGTRGRVPHFCCHSKQYMLLFHGKQHLLQRKLLLSQINCIIYYMQLQHSMSDQISVSSALEQDSFEGVDTTEWLVRHTLRRRRRRGLRLEQVWDVVRYDFIDEFSKRLVFFISKKS